METLNKNQVLSALNISERTLENWVRDNRFPRPVRLGKRSYWLAEAVIKWKELTFAYQLDFHPVLGTLAQTEIPVKKRQ